MDFYTSPNNKLHVINYSETNSGGGGGGSTQKMITLIEKISFPFYTFVFIFRKHQDKFPN